MKERRLLSRPSYGSHKMRQGTAIHHVMEEQESLKQSTALKKYRVSRCAEGRLFYRKLQMVIVAFHTSAETMYRVKPAFRVV